MKDYILLPEQLKTAALLHIQKGVPLSDIAISRTKRDMICRVKFVYYMYLKDPAIDVYSIFLELAKYPGGFDRRQMVALSFASREEALLHFIADNKCKWQKYI